jgi:fumarate hydratase subunit beta
MDKYAPTLLDMGLLGMIGKGNRDENVCDAIVRNSAIYFAAIGGAGALISKSVLKCETVCYEDLGTEAVRKLTINDFYVTVVIDGNGKTLYR